MNLISYNLPRTTHQTTSIVNKVIVIVNFTLSITCESLGVSTVISITFGRTVIQKIVKIRKM